MCLELPVRLRQENTGYDAAFNLRLHQKLRLFTEGIKHEARTFKAEERKETEQRIQRMGWHEESLLTSERCRLRQLRWQGNHGLRRME